MPTEVLLGFGHVHHTRLRPVRHAFVYRTYFLMLPMRSLGAEKANLPTQNLEAPKQALAINRPGAISFYDQDHGDGRSPAEGGALAWLDAMLAQQGIQDATGEVWLHCYPRVLGFAFKPVSFWYCHKPERDGGALRAIVVEVNNTFGERHCYLLDAPEFGKELTANKVFHVSPFCSVQGCYRFRFVRGPEGPGESTFAQIALDDADGPLLHTSVNGTLQSATRRTLLKAFWGYPLLSFGVVLHIHWQAARLWLKRVAWWRKPLAPDQFVTRG